MRDRIGTSGALLVGATWQAFLRYVPPPPLVSLETGLAALLLVLNLRDLGRCIRFIGTTVRSLAKQRRRKPASQP
jgi:hypothetical protein